MPTGKGHPSGTSEAALPEVDPITLECVCEGLQAIVREMRAAVKSTAYSSVIYEMDDFSCGLFDPQTRLIAQGEDHPGHVIPLPWSVQCAMADFAGDLQPGDLILLNDPYRGGTHLNDVTLIYPVFLDGALFVFPAVREHWTDVGGMVPGSYSGLSTEIYQEGVRIPPLKICERGVFNRAALALLWANMRVPHEREGDFWAAVAALKTAEQRILEMVKKYGRDTFLRCVEWNLARSEARMRAQIRALPDGVYEYEDYLEFYHDGRLDPVLMHLTLTIAGDHLYADFSGSSPQVAGVVNASLAVTATGVFAALKAVLDPEGPINSGVFRAITVTAPEKTITNVGPYAPAGAHGEVRKRAASVTLGALAQVIPERVCGDLCGTSFPNAIGGANGRRGEPFVYYDALAGGNGAYGGGDGVSVMGNLDFGDIKTVLPAEALEIEFPLRVERLALRPDSGGDGQFRGGLGGRREVRLLSPRGAYSVLADRAVLPPFGVCGGYAAAPVRTTVVRGGKELPFATPGKVTGFPLQEGDVVVMESAGGGGYGSPLARAPEEVAADVREGYLSAEKARQVYGVVLRDDGSPDPEATAALRQALRAAARRVRVQHSDADPYRGQEGKHRVVVLHPALAASLQLAAGDLVELWGRHGAPLRAWVEVDAHAPETAVPLDSKGQRMLGVQPGDQVEIRCLRKATSMPMGT
ncbi:MAG: 5-oxoprolinase [Candidatus Tectimicrobiota bacterium]|nr:MAG: 5-oxoprolinase [Candidatus Tectomicrobia bacterium]